MFKTSTWPTQIPMFGLFRRFLSPFDTRDTGSSSRYESEQTHSHKLVWDLVRAHTNLLCLVSTTSANVLKATYFKVYDIQMIKSLTLGPIRECQRSRGCVFYPINECNACEKSEVASRSMDACASYAS